MTRGRPVTRVAPRLPPARRAPAVAAMIRRFPPVNPENPNDVR